MAQTSDDLYLGAAVTQILGTTTDYSTPSVSAPTTSLPNGGVGVGPMGRTYTYDVVPLTLQAASLAASQTPAGAGSLTLTAGTGITTTTVPGTTTTAYVIDVPRSVSVTSAADISNRTLTITGYDVYWTPMTGTYTGPNATTINSTKAFKYITGITISGAAAGALTVGVGDKFGMPYRVLDINHIISVKWASALANDAGTAVAAVTTDPATATTGDVRGTYQPSSASNGSRRLTMTLFLPGIASGPNATRAGALGVTQA